MAIDTAAKRSAAILHRRSIRPDGTVDANDRAALTGVYFGLAAPVPIAIFSAGYVFLFEHMLTGIIVGPVELAGCSYEDYLCRPGRAEAVMAMADADANAEILDEGKWAMYVVRDGLIDWGGPLMKIEIPLGSEQVQLALLGWLHMLARRSIRVDRSFTATEQFEIVQTLVADAQDETNIVNGVGADLGITVTWDTPSGVLRDRTTEYRAFNGKNLLEAITELANCENGFDFRMRFSFEGDRIVKELVLTHPRQGVDYRGSAGFEFTRPAAGFEYLRTQVNNILRRGIVRDASNMAWRQRGWGAGADVTRLYDDETDELKRGIYPFYDADTTFSSVTNPDTLEENTLGALERTTNTERTPALEVDPDLDPRWGTYGLGDIFEVSIVDGYASLAGGYRIIGYKMNADTDRPTLYVEEAV